jgi:hypothetical protein
VLKRTNDLSVASWFFVNFPILNVGLSAGLPPQTGDTCRREQEDYPGDIVVQ